MKIPPPEDLQIAGVKCFAVESMTIPGDAVEVPRSIMERLFSLPWRPLQATKRTYTQVPDPIVYQTGSGDVYGHPETLRKMFSAIKETQS